MSIGYNIIATAFYYPAKKYTQYAIFHRKTYIITLTQLVRSFYLAKRMLILSESPE